MGCEGNLVDGLAPHVPIDDFPYRIDDGNASAIERATLRVHSKDDFGSSGRDQSAFKIRYDVEGPSPNRLDSRAYCKVQVRFVMARAESAHPTYDGVGRAIV